MHGRARRPYGLARPMCAADTVSGVKGAGRRLSARLGRAARRMTAGRKRPSRGKSLSYSTIAGGCAIVAYGVINASLSLALVGASFLATGVFARSMMGATKDISERLFEGQERILEAIQGPPQFDKDGKPIVKGNLLDKLDKLDENHAVLVGKMDDVIAAINRLTDAVNRMSPNRP